VIVVLSCLFEDVLMVVMVFFVYGFLIVISMFVSAMCFVLIVSLVLILFIWIRLLWVFELDDWVNFLCFV